MYSRNMKRGRDGTYAVPPGYDGSRFRRGGNVNRGEFVPDSDFLPERDEPLSIGGIPTNAGLRSHKSTTEREYASEDETAFPEAGADETAVTEPAVVICDKENHRSDSIRDFFARLGYSGIGRDDLLLIGLIFLLVTEKEYEGTGEMALLLALIFGVR